MNYVGAEMRRHLEEKLYRVYITNSIQGIGEGKTLKYRYIDLLNNEIPAEDNRTGDEIATDIMKKAGLRFAE